MANRKPATPTQVRRVLISLGNGASIRACAEEYRLSKSTIERIKAGTYPVKPELNKFEETLRPGLTRACRRKSTTLPEDYQQREIANRDAFRESQKGRQQAIKTAAAGHPYPDAKRLLEKHLQGPTLMDPEGTFWVQEALYPSKDFQADISNRYQNQRFTSLVQEIHQRKAAGESIEKHEYPDAVWRGFYMVHERTGLSTAEQELTKFDRGTQTEFAKLRDHYDAQFDFLEAVTPADESTPRWVDRAHRQLGRWHREEATRGTIIRIEHTAQPGKEDTSLWINDQIERTTKLPGMSASELMEGIRKDDAIEESPVREPEAEPVELYDDQGRRVNEDGILRLVGNDLLEQLIRDELDWEPTPREEIRRMASEVTCSAARAWWKPLFKSSRSSSDVFDFTKEWRFRLDEFTMFNRPPGRLPILTARKGA